jgi:hypothetical protein
MQLKIISSGNLKFIISFLVLPLVLLHSYQSFSFVASMQHAPLRLHVYLRLAIRPSAQLQISWQEWPPSNGDRYCLSASQGSVLVAQAFAVMYLEPRVRHFFPYYLLNVRNQGNSYQQATYKDQISMVLQQSAVFLFQETNHLNTFATTRPTYYESRQVGIRWTMSTRMQLHKTPWAD